MIPLIKDTEKRQMYRQKVEQRLSQTGRTATGMCSLPVTAFLLQMTKSLELGSGNGWTTM